MRPRVILAEHPHVEFHFTPTYFVMAQSSRDLVFEAATRGHRPRHFHIGRRSALQGSALHPAVRKIGKAISVEVFQRPSPHSR